jgi:hypothetical protein
MSTEICNMALGRIGAKRINNYDDNTETKPQAIQCRLHFEQTRNALQRSHFWVFNKRRASLSEDTETPDFEYDHQFLLPNDFLRYRYKYDSNANHNAISDFSFSLETKSDGTKILLTDETSVNLVYSALIEDPTAFDALYTELLVLKLAQKLVTPLAGGNKEIMREIKDDILRLEPRVRALDRNEGIGTRKEDQATWNDARTSGYAGATVASS